MAILLAMTALQVEGSTSIILAVGPLPVEEIQTCAYYIIFVTVWYDLSSALGSR